MHVHGFLFCFVIGIYGETVRIARFDHTCAIRRADILQRFFWHFVHPIVEGPVVGCDPTVRCLCDDDKSWVKHCLEKRDDPDATDPHFDENVRHGKRLLVQDEQTGAQSWYVTYKLVDINARLFSRATTVWRAIEDTRIMGKGGRLIADKTRRKEAPKVRILKESWRQLVRKSEAAFYQRLQSKIPDSKRHGLTKLECGADSGQVEVREWERSAKPDHAVYMEGQCDLRLSLGEYSLEHTTSETSSRSSMSPPVPANAGKSSAGDGSPVHYDAEETTSAPATLPRFTIVDGREISGSASAHLHPLPFPQHQTFSWAVACNVERSYRERSHMRFIVTDVGRPITKFKATSELILAMRDAIIGNCSFPGTSKAYGRAGLLHRDVSMGNILIVDNPEPGHSYTGFLHDFDYSSVVEELEDILDDADDVVDIPASAFADMSDQHWSILEGRRLPEPGDAVAAQKERTGTYYFMAVEMLTDKVVIHKPRHDLESYYWVLLWIIIRHTLHSLGQQRCEEIFVYAKDSEANMRKWNWVTRNDIEEKSYLVHVSSNRPLTLLLRRYRELVRNQINAKTELDYDSVLAIFDDALNMDGWPSDSDWIECTLLDKPKTHGSLVNDNRRALPQAAHPAESVDSEARIPSLMETIRRSFKGERSKTKASAGSRGSQSKLLKPRPRSSGPGPSGIHDLPMAGDDTPTRAKRRKSEVDDDEGSEAEQVVEEEPVAGPSTLASHDPKRRRTAGTDVHVSSYYPCPELTFTVSNVLHQSSCNTFNCTVYWWVVQRPWFLPSHALEWSVYPILWNMTMVCRRRD
ncbi:hypothetical protein C8Q80DRAFT_1166696 [Daedaleopsis nitida]|nr:hypothetical protein C8Q80DRAFT_1166696 [Daedaleopsis nitida]